MAKTSWFKSRRERGLKPNQPPGREPQQSERAFQPLEREDLPQNKAEYTTLGVKVMKPTVEENAKEEIPIPE